MPHPPLEQLVAWTAGDLTPTQEQALEAHVDQCDDCASRLSALARQELDFHQIADASLHRPRANRWAWPVAVVALAAAAGMVIWFMPSRSQDLPTPPQQTTQQTEDLTPDCRSHPEFDACASEAIEQGLWIPDVEVPRYEAEAACLTCGREG
ncbi:MAG: anti-sigma factor [Myxococcota bacterium]